jgi:hypothetical protein
MASLININYGTDKFIKNYEPTAKRESLKENKKN